MKRKISTREKIKIAKEVMARAVEISETTEHDVFAEYSPHVDSISWQVYEGGWGGINEERTPEIYYIRFNSEYFDPLEQLQHFNRRMSELEAAE